MTEGKDIRPALLTRTQICWLQDKIQLSNSYERKIKSDIRKRLKIFNELEVPLLVKSGFITATANCNIVTTDCNMNSPSNLSMPEIQSQNMVGREGLIWNFRRVLVSVSEYSNREY